MDAISAFASAQMDRIYIKDDSHEDLLLNQARLEKESRDSMVVETESA